MVNSLEKKIVFLKIHDRRRVKSAQRNTKKIRAPGSVRSKFFCQEGAGPYDTWGSLVFAQCILFCRFFCRKFLFFY